MDLDFVLDFFNPTPKYAKDFVLDFFNPTPKYAKIDLFMS